MSAIVDWITANPQLVTAVVIPTLVWIAKWLRDQLVNFIPDELLPVLAMVLGEVIGQVAGMPTTSGAIAGAAGVGGHQAWHQWAKKRKNGSGNGRLRGPR